MLEGAGQLAQRSRTDALASYRSMCNPIPDKPPGVELCRTWTTRATHFTSLDDLTASSCGMRSDTSTGVPTFIGTLVIKYMPRCDKFSDSANCSVDPGLLSARNRRGTRIFTRVSIRRSLELMVFSLPAGRAGPLAGLSARGYQSRKGVNSILARREAEAREMRISRDPWTTPGQVVP